jgi:hypothetical protein
MMTPRELAVIKGYQREFQRTFGKRLEIDFAEMKDLKFMADEGQTLEQALLECVERHGADIKVVKDTNVRLNRSTTRKERAAIVDFSRFVIGNNLCVKDASELIKRDRSNIYHYAGCR